ncbi:MAG: proteasome accessory factor PafA2 family protein, partial [Myxococcota bacterium]|nr:proteasome accessory factor PafA2 family protein [Myxococcota bacterium]
MRDRVFGIETEYALIYHPARGETRRPTNLELWPLFEQALDERVRSLPRAFSLLRAKPGRFLENGASFHYEATPRDFEHGLLEMASPECRDPFTLLCHERAKDLLAETLAARVSGRLRRAGFEGEVRVGKNNVDSQGHTFGSHESYWVDDPLPAALRLLLAPVWAALWLLTLPALLWLLLASAGVVLALAGLALLPAVGALTARAGHALARRLPGAGRRLAGAGLRLQLAAMRRLRELQRHPGELPRRLAWIEAPLGPLLALHSRVYDRFHFRRIRRDATAFLVTRTLFAGAGAVRLGEGPPLLRLAQRPPFLRAVSRIFTHGDARPLFESRDVFFRPWSAFGSRRRLHLMLGDANLCDWALVLRVGATALVLEAIESGAAVDWPQLAAPLDALRTVNEDPERTARLPLREGPPATALTL